VIENGGMPLPGPPPIFRHALNIRRTMIKKTDAKWQLPTTTP